MSPQAQVKWEQVTTWLLRTGVFLLSVIFTLALSIFNQTKEDVNKIKTDVQQLLQYRAGDDIRLKSVENQAAENRADIKRWHEERIRNNK